MRDYKRYEIEVLTPLHIGSGEKIYPLEYVIDKEFIRVNMDKLFAEPSFDREGFIKKSKEERFYLGNFDKGNALKYPLYKIGIGSDVADKLVRNLGTPNALILDFIKEGKGFYIPGSSLKGGIRTALLWNMLQQPDIKRKYENGLQNELNRKRDPQRGRGIRRERFSLPSEEAILGSPNYSLLRALHVGDSNFLSPSSICVKVSKVLSKTGDSFKWKQLGRDGRNLDTPEEATPIFFEAVKAVKPGADKISGSFKIDEFLLQEEISSSLGLRGTSLLEEIVKTCNTFARDHLRREEIFFKSVGLKQIQDGIQRVKNISLRDNEFLLHLAWGSGYEAKAVGNIIDKSLFADIKKEWRLGRGIEFPKTRKIVFEEEKPEAVTGWVKVRLEA